ncbi:phosphotransferase [Streptomyces sp. NPDC059479]|uniref:phosphotransferase n=1 Tax=Streptomyces sp. NPDC059479 TaxID=3346848 RepID=UPI00367EBD21
MTLTTNTSVTQPGGLPEPEQVFAFAEREIRRAGAELWPGAELIPGALVPSVTGYVRLLRVDGRELYAKYSYLGVSLVSLLRGVGGDWALVRWAQRTYTACPEALLTREAAQLRLLAAFGQPKVCAVAGLRRGVLFTEPVTGPTLAALLIARPQEAGDLLEAAYGGLHRLHSPRISRAFDPVGAIGERGIVHTFQRKFNGLSGALYLDLLGIERCAEHERREIVQLMRHVVGRLRRLRAAARTLKPTVLVYGDLKPEHVFFPDGFFPDGLDSEPVFIDPGLLRASGPEADAAKLISRTVLLLAASRPSPSASLRVLDGIAAFIDQRLSPLPRPERSEWLYAFLILWLTDTVNILTTYLSAPAALPLPGQGEALVRQAVTLCGMADRISALLAGATDGTGVTDGTAALDCALDRLLDRVLSEAAAAVAAVAS